MLLLLMLLRCCESAINAVCNKSWLQLVRVYDCQQAAEAGGGAGIEGSAGRSRQRASGGVTGCWSRAAAAAVERGDSSKGCARRIGAAGKGAGGRGQQAGDLVNSPHHFSAQYFCTF